MPRKSTRKNFKKIRGGDPDPPSPGMFSSLTSFSMPSMPSFSAPSFSMPSFSMPSFMGGPTEEKKTEYPTEGGKNKRKRRKMRGGAYTSNSSTYGANAGSYSGSPTARAQAYVGGRRTRRKKSKY